MANDNNKPRERSRFVQTPNNPTRILLVDDDRQQFLLIGYLLSEAHHDDYRLIWCQDLDDALYQIEHEQCDAVLLDYHWEIAGEDFIYRAHLLNKRIPILIMTDSMDRDVDFKALSEGASDYLVKDYISSEILERAIRYSIERKKIEQHLDHLAHYDHLTDLPNRILFQDRLNQAVSLGQRSGDSFTLMYIDLNDFKEVNDNYGHDTGDKLLKEFARRLQAGIRRSDTVARIGGDEFTILLNNIGSTPKIISLSQKLIESIERPFRIGMHELSVGCSVGIAVFPEAGTDAEILQRHADTAMYQAKQSGCSSYRFFTSCKRDVLSMERLTPEALQVLINNNEFELSFTPRMDVNTCRVSTIAVNPIWLNASEDNKYYKDFATQIENNETVQLLTEWIIDQTFTLMSEFVKQYDISLSFSVRPRQLQSSQFGFYIKQISQQYDISTAKIEFCLLDKKTSSKNIFLEECIDNVADIGAIFCLDKFGKNTLSLASMHRYDIPVLFMESALLQSAFLRKRDEQLVGTLFLLAHQLDRKVIASDIKCHKQVELLKVLNCDYVQGPIFGEKLSLKKINECLVQYNSLAPL